MFVRQGDTSFVAGIIDFDDAPTTTRFLEAAEECGWSVKVISCFSALV